MRPTRTIPRGLSEDEAAAWARLAATVKAFDPPAQPAKAKRKPVAPLPEPAATAPTPTSATANRPIMPPVALHTRAALNGPAPRAGDGGLDSHWERKLRAGTLMPDFTLDLHDHSLDAAYQRLLGGLDFARETGARVVLVIAGRERPTHAADRGGQRGAIRAKLLDWLAASRHASAIASIRKAHRRHGGEGALYVVLKRAR